jgi:UDP-N-acetylmuramyl pentapeptide phosphotransferase/UDP-N-acetylglucosamine-1-phosphate transferase
MIEQAIGRLLVLGPAALVALFLSLELIVLLRPWLVRHALAQPNTRSSHREPTPQGGGVAVIASTLAVAWGAVALAPSSFANSQLLAVTAAAVVLAVVGALDDIRSVPATARLAVQCLAVACVIAALPSGLRILPQVPWLIERACLFLGWVWFVNLVNFMDGIDWMTVAEVVPITGAIVMLGLFGVIEQLPALVAAALLGAMLGFAPFNKPVAKLFLGDMGSLPIGLLLGWLLLELAEKGHLAAALILPLYYLADATTTLARRIIRREPFWRAHRTHFYQRATDAGLSVPAIVTRVLLVNVVFAALALVTVAAASAAVSIAALATASAIAAWFLRALARGSR